MSGKTSVASRLIFSSNDIGRKAVEFLYFILKCILLVCGIILNDQDSSALGSVNSQYSPSFIISSTLASSCSIAIFVKCALSLDSITVTISLAIW